MNNGERFTRVRPNGKPNPRIDFKRKPLAQAEGGGSLSARLTHELLKKIGRPIKCMGEDWYVYDGVRWVQRKREVYKPLALEVQELNSRNHRRTIDILNFLEDQRQLREGEEFCGAINNNGKDSYLLNFVNGTLEIDRVTGEMMQNRKHDPGDMFTLVLGRYDDIPCDFFRQILRQILPSKEDRRLLLDFFASALMPDSRFEVALFCVGNGANGKSVITEALANAIGSEVCSALTLHQICGNERKHMYRLAHKLINVATETDTSAIANTSLFKSVVSGETFETEMLYRKAGFEMQTNVKNCFLMNYLPPIKHGGEGDMRRIRTLYFANRFTEDGRDIWLRRKLQAERGGILALLVNRLPRLAELNELTKGSTTSQHLWETFCNNTDIIYSFFRNCVIFMGGSRSTKCVSKDNLYKIFRKYCKENDRNLVPIDSQFFKVAKSLFPEFNFNYRKFLRGTSPGIYVNCVAGITLNERGYSLLNEITSDSFL